MTIIDGKKIAQDMRMRLADKVQDMKESVGIVPGLAVIVVGDNPASQVYVRNKERAALAAGFHSETIRLPEKTSEAELLEVVDQCNHNPSLHGILVQLPLPDQINDKKVLLAIDPHKDVDGFHPMNTGHLWSGRPIMVPCTPAGIMALLDAYDVRLEGRRAVIIGRSNIVGKPMAQLLLAKDATVTLTHSRTKDLQKLAKEADILIVAIGRPEFVTKEFVKEGAVVIDVGINRQADGKLVGDVAFEEVAQVAKLITPVPGGVGPMTIALLLEQTYQAALRSVTRDD